MEIECKNTKKFLFNFLKTNFYPTGKYEWNAGITNEETVEQETSDSFGRKFLSLPKNKQLRLSKRDIYSRILHVRTKLIF
jgi:hypothetical protein